DSFSNHDGTTDAGTTHTEHRIHDTTGSSNSHHLTTWDQSGGNPVHHGSHEDRFVEHFGSHEVTDRTVVGGIPTSYTQSGTEDEDGTATVTDDRLFDAYVAEDDLTYRESRHSESVETYRKHRDLGASPTQTWDQNGTWSKLDNSEYQLGQAHTYINTDAIASY